MRARTPGADGGVIEAPALAYAAPRTLADVLDLLARYQDDAKLLAGGQSLLVLVRQGLVRPAVLISLRKVAELRTTTFSEQAGLSIGAATTQAQLERMEVLRTHYSALAEAAGLVATTQVRTLGTLGGNLCHADPTADPPAALIALGARLEIVGPAAQREVAIDEFFRDFMDVDLAPDEILVRVTLPPPAAASGSAYEKHRLRPVDTALIGAAVWIQIDPADGTIRDARVGLAAAGPTPLRSHAAEDALRGAAAEPLSLGRAAAAAAETCAPLSDTEASEWYRRRMVRVFVERAGRRALERASAAAQHTARSQP